jgi:hypothetical protein
VLQSLQKITRQAACGCGLLSLDNPKKQSNGVATFKQTKIPFISTYTQALDGPPTYRAST